MGICGDESGEELVETQKALLEANATFVKLRNALEQAACPRVTSVLVKKCVKEGRCSCNAKEALVYVKV